MTSERHALSNLQRSVPSWEELTSLGRCSSMDAIMMVSVVGSSSKKGAGPTGRKRRTVLQGQGDSSRSPESICNKKNLLHVFTGGQYERNLWEWPHCLLLCGVFHSLTRDKSRSGIEKYYVWFQNLTTNSRLVREFLFPPLHTWTHTFLWLPYIYVLLGELQSAVRK